MTVKVFSSKLGFRVMTDRAVYPSKRSQFGFDDPASYLVGYRLIRALFRRMKKPHLGEEAIALLEEKRKAYLYIRRTRHI